MSHYLRLTFRLFDRAFHGRGDGGVPEWPPSPLRAFQALVATAGHRFRTDREFDESARGSLEWLQELGSPDVIAPAGEPSGRAYRLYVPNNHADVVAAAWSGGDRFASIAEHRVEKDVRLTRLTNGDAVHYLWPVPSDKAEHARVLNDIARGVSHLGWGIDQAAASVGIVSTADVDKLAGERWTPAENGGTSLRVPKSAGPAAVGTLADLRRKHADFVRRLGPDGFKPVPSLREFTVVGYRRASDPAGRRWAAFRILSADPDDPRNLAFDTPRRCRDIAAWVRHATARVCEGWPYGDTDGFVCGHSAGGQPLTSDDRFTYLPLPTIGRRGDRGEYVGAIRRVLIAAPPQFGEQVEWVRRRLPGQALVWDGNEVGLLTELPDSDWVRRQYTGPACVWSTVTPVIWPGHDDKNPRKAETLLRRAFFQAGLPAEVVHDIEELDWRPVGFRAGVERADRYRRPDGLIGRTYHVRVRFSHPVAGPLAVGSGRYRGLGLFAADPAS